MAKSDGSVFFYIHDLLIPYSQQCLFFSFFELIKTF